MEEPAFLQLLDPQPRSMAGIPMGSDAVMLVGDVGERLHVARSQSFLLLAATIMLVGKGLGDDNELRGPHSSKESPCGEGEGVFHSSSQWDASQPLSRASSCW